MKVCYIEIMFKGKWKWAGTFYRKKIGQCFDEAFKSLTYIFDGQKPDDYRIKIGEPSCGDN